MFFSQPHDSGRLPSACVRYQPKAKSLDDLVLPYERGISFQPVVHVLSLHCASYN